MVRRFRIFHPGRGETWGLNINNSTAILRILSGEFHVFYIIIKIIMPSTTMSLDGIKVLHFKNDTQIGV